MWPILLCLGGGIVLGCVLKMSDSQRVLNGRLQFTGIMLLLFSMGISIGMNESIIFDMFKISGQAFTFAVLCTLFSVIMVYTMSSYKERRDHRR